MILADARAKKWAKEVIMDPIRAAADEVKYELSPKDYADMRELRDESARDTFIHSLRSRKALDDAQNILTSEGFDSKIMQAYIANSKSLE